MEKKEKKEIIYAILEMKKLEAFVLKYSYNEDKERKNLEEVTDLNLALSFQNMTNRLKMLRIKRTDSTYISAIIYKKLENIIKRGSNDYFETSITNANNLNKKTLRNKEDMDIIYGLKGMQKKDFDPKKRNYFSSLLDSQKLEQTSSETLDDLLALCLYYRLIKASAICETNQKYGLDMPHELESVMKQIKGYFPNLHDFRNCITHWNIAEWQTMSIEACFECFQECISEWMYKPTFKKNTTTRGKKMD